MYILILFGPPGAGKGTQALKIATKFNWKHISTGDILRAEVNSGTLLGMKVKAVMEAGHLVSDELLIEIIEAAFLTHGAFPGFVLDGFPRTINQAEELDRMLLKHGCKVDQVLALVVNEAELTTRLVIRAVEQGRKDDTENVFRNRLVQYHHHTKPLVDYYKQKEVYSEVQGVGTIDDIFNTLCSLIKP